MYVIPQEIEAMNVHQRIHGMMSEIDYIQKLDKMVNGNYRYVSHDQVKEKVHPLLVKYRLLFIPDITGITQDGNRTAETVKCRVINIDNPKDYIEFTMAGYGIDPSDKGPGKAVSYATKYAFLQLLQIQTGDDPDNDANTVYEAPKCQEFDLMIPIETSEKAKLKKFLAYSAEVMKIDVEEVKRTAIKRIPEFLQAFRNWVPEKKKKEEEK